MISPIPRHRTALSRAALSRPIATVLNDGLLTSENTLFDYGCGRGDDLLRLEALGITCAGWDPTHRPDEEPAASDVVNLGYVLNVIENASERVEALRRAWHVTRELLVVSARLTWDARGLRGRPRGDGIITSTGTFQKFYTQDELRTWIEATIDGATVPAAPGIIYVFRDPAHAHELLANRVRRSIAPPEPWICERLYEQHHHTLEPLVDFLTNRGRLPRGTELPSAESLRRKFGSLARAFSIISTVTGTEHWERLRKRHAADVLGYLALARFDGRPRFSHLPESLRYDVREFFRSYKAGCAAADKLLLSAGDADTVDLATCTSPAGKQTPSALYVHTDALQHLPPVLRVLDGCARTLVGTVPNTDVIKLHRDKPIVSYLSYPGFGDRPHPTLATALTVNLRTRQADLRDYRHSPNPPILHRTEEFLAPDDPRRDRLSAITDREVRAGLYEHPELIGTLEGWRSVCESRRRS
ncbi:DNA phosphorothioation-associated putative methyltransferase [Haloechinothrix halophila]|uniref:DNA phosphorothioation-associated putative methyltransferase n=1 Tax=Haloechinothrix halophila TaxID=1069073 RepID=UPI0003F5F062|nr:DNA phosphorothioation-associated putative methyltransferase [Haloechinothrix halophila]